MTKRSLVSKRTEGVNPNATRDPLTYWVSRDSDADGKPSTHVDVWLHKPIRRALTLYGGAYWVVEDESAPDDHYYGRYPVEHVRDKWRHAVPDTDLELIRRETVSDLK